MKEFKFLKFLKKDKISELLKRPGVYAFKSGKQFLYIGKAADIKERVKNHFQQPAYRDHIFIDKIQKIGFIETDSEIEALVLEANLIKKLQPKFNVLWRDDKNYFFVAVTKNYNPPTALPFAEGKWAPDFPRVFITHQRKLKNKNLAFGKNLDSRSARIKNDKLKTEYVGPFVDGKALKEALTALRKIFPYRSCRKIPKRACLWYQLKRCPAPCLLKGRLALQIPHLKIKKESKENVDNLLKILKGEKIVLLKRLEKEMKAAVKIQDFEKAARSRDKIFSLNKVLANAKIFRARRVEDWSEIKKSLKQILRVKTGIKRVEAYDVSNIQGKLATAAAVTFINGEPDKNFYRRFKIKVSGKPDDIAMLRECLIRRFKHPEWGSPDLILIDGGKAQLNVAKEVVKDLKIRVVSLAKGKKNVFVDNRKEPLPLKEISEPLKFFILRSSDEAHRFALKYHRKLRKKQLFKVGL